MANLAKEPLTLVEIDLPYCTRTYGSAPCTAVLGTTGDVKCFNSRFTCQDPTNYVAGTKTVTFAPNIDGIPDAPGVFPALSDASGRPGELNLSGFDPSSTALGVRARVNVTLQDFANNDTWLDKYQSERVSGAALFSGVGYDPATRGRFLARMFARFPYYLGVSLRVRRGYVGDAPASMPTENYVISELTGPNAAGAVQITAKDILDLAENDKAVMPIASTGKLLAAITAADTSATLTPSGIGDDEYPASGMVRVGRELITFTRASDVLTLTRGQDGTVAADHSAMDVVQICEVLDGLSINQAVEQVLKYNTTAFDTYIPTADWQDENDTWYSGMVIGRVILSKPIGKKTLVGELCQLGVMVWWDAIDQEIKFKVNSPLLPSESYVSITDDDNMIEGSPEVDRSEDQRVSALWFFHGVRDWTSDNLSAENFDKLTIAALQENLYGQDAYKEVFTRWFGRSGDDVSVAVISERLLGRYKDVPNVVSGVLDVKDRASVKLGTRIRLESYVLQDVDGAVLAEPMQINYAEYSDGRVKFRAETYRIDGRFMFWLDSATAPADYSSATPAQREAGAFWGDETSPGMPDGTYDYVWF